MNKHGPNGWAKVIIVVVIFVCCTLVLLIPQIPSTGLGAFFALSTLALYLAFHVQAGDQPPTGGSPS